MSHCVINPSIQTNVSSLKNDDIIAIEKYFQTNYDFFDKSCTSIVSIVVTPEINCIKKEFNIHICIKYNKNYNTNDIYTSETVVKMWKESDRYIYRNDGVITTYLKMFGKHCLELVDNFIHLYNEYHNNAQN